MENNIYCKICGKKIELTTEMHYIARDAVEVGCMLFKSQMEPELYDAIDCPYCGSQNILGTRKHHYDESNEDTDDQIIELEEE